MTGIASQTGSFNGVVVDNPGVKGNGVPTGNEVHDDHDERVSDEDEEEDEEDDYEVCRGLSNDGLLLLKGDLIYRRNNRLLEMKMMSQKRGLMGMTKKTGKWKTKVVRVRVRVKPGVETEYDRFLFFPKSLCLCFSFSHQTLTHLLLGDVRILLPAIL
jgi:hypothetical protein